MSGEALQLSFQRRAVARYHSISDIYYFIILKMEVKS